MLKPDSIAIRYFKLFHIRMHFAQLLRLKSKILEFQLRNNAQS